MTPGPRLLRRRFRKIVLDAWGAAVPQLGHDLDRQVACMVEGPLQARQYLPVLRAALERRNA